MCFVFFSSQTTKLRRVLCSTTTLFDTPPACSVTLKKHHFPCKVVFFSPDGHKCRLLQRFSPFMNNYRCTRGLEWSELSASGISGAKGTARLSPKHWRRLLPYMENWKYCCVLPGSRGQILHVPPFKSQEGRQSFLLSEQQPSEFFRSTLATLISESSWLVKYVEHTRNLSPVLQAALVSS